MRILITAALLAHAGAASAHHAFAADYEAGNEGVVEGTITEVIYKNPHARYYIEVDDDGMTSMPGVFLPGSRELPERQRKSMLPLSE